MAFGDIPNSERIVISINSSLRFGQIVVGAATIGLYAPEKGFWVNQGLPDKINYEFAIGSFAIMTGLLLGALPFISSYHHVTLAAPWDMTMFFFYSVAFGLMRAIIAKFTHEGHLFEVSNGNTAVVLGHMESMEEIVWMNLAGMSLFLIPALMGAMLFWIGRRTAGGGLGFGRGFGKI